MAEIKIKTKAEVEAIKAEKLKSAVIKQCHGFKRDSSK